MSDQKPESMLGYELKPLPDSIDQEWINQASDLDLAIARSRGLVQGGGIFTRPTPQKEKVSDRPNQLTREQMRAMKPEEVLEAWQAGQFDELLGN